MAAKGFKTGDTIILEDFNKKPSDWKLTCNGEYIDFTLKDMGNNTFELTIK